MRLISAVVLCVMAAAPCAGAAAAATVVVLPPRVNGADAETATAANLLCDRLAQRIAQSRDVKVVDRTQLERIVAERALTTAPGPVLSFDAMVRVSVDTSGPLRRVSLTVIDLSLGNVAGSKTFPWRKDRPAGPVADMAKLCVSAARAVAAAPKGGLKVRLVPPVLPYRAERLEPLAERLTAAFARAVDRSPAARRVRHLEAGAAAEESLLLLIGLSRLPGGRRFAPHADAAVEVRLSEVDPMGKSFQQTTVKLEYRVTGKAASQWASVSGKVADWDAVVARAWRGLAAKLAGTDPAAARDYLDALAVRRRQARAEMEKLRSMNATGYPSIHNFRKATLPPGRGEEIVRLADTASKLDPTNEEAAFVAVKFHYVLRRADAAESPGRAVEILTPSVREAHRYLRSFHSDADHRSEVCDVASEATSRILLACERAGSADPGVLDRLARLAAVAVAVPHDRFLSGWGAGVTLKELYDAMTVAGMDAASCRRWRDRCLAVIDSRLRQASFQDKLGFRYEQGLISLRTIQAEAALAEGDAAAARKHLTALLEEFPRIRHIYGSTHRTLTRTVGRLGDAELAARVTAALKDRRNYFHRTVPTAVTWPADRLEGAPERPTIAGTIISVEAKTENPHVALRCLRVVGVIGRRLYVIVHAYGHRPTLRMPESRDFAIRPRLAYFQLDARGHASGGELTFCPMPTPRHESQINQARVHFGRICLATDRAGLMIYDPGANAWTIYGPKHGLPTWRVRRIHPAGPDTLLCFTYVSRKPAVCSFHLPSKRVVLRRKLTDFHEPPFAVWEADGKWLGLHRNGMIANLMMQDPTIRAWGPLTPQGWQRKRALKAPGPHGSVLSPVVTCVVDGARFASFPDTLRKLDENGKVLREWPVTFWAHMESGPISTVLRYTRITVPGEVPGRILIGGDGSHLYMSSPAGVSLFELATDTWYGPVVIKDVKWWYHGTGQVVPGGLWYGREPLRFVSRDEILSAARAAGLVATSDQLKKRLAETIKAAPPFDRAKLAFSLRRFEEAKTLLDKVIAADGGNLEALIVMGLLHEEFATNRPAEALRWYRRVAEVAEAAGDARGHLAGLLLQFHRHKLDGRRAEAIKLGWAMLRQFDIETNCRAHLAKDMGKLLAAEAAAKKRAAAETGGGGNV